LAPVPSNNASLYNLFTPQLSISYMPDIFGLNQRTVESLAAQQQSVRYQMIAATITLSTNVAAAAIQLGSLETQVDATRQLIAINTDMLKVVQYQFTRGYASRLDMAAQQS
jgi:outer membrane protein TolC